MLKMDRFHGTVLSEGFGEMLEIPRGLEVKQTDITVPVQFCGGQRLAWLHGRVRLWMSGLCRFPIDAARVLHAGFHRTTAGLVDFHQVNGVSIGRC
jgi:hypothetical protein